MQVTNSTSAFYGQMGLQRSQDSLEKASAQVAVASTAVQSSEESQTGYRSDSEIRDGLVTAKQSELEAQANVKVIETADEMLGTLIDIEV